MTKPSFPPGIYAASLTWFLEGEGQLIDRDTQKKHFTHLINAGLTGIVTSGSNGEAVALSNEERIGLVSLARSVAIECGRDDLPIVAGTVGQTTMEVITQLQMYDKAGANFGLVLTPSYFHFAMTASAIQDFFMEVADASPIPICLYSWPLVTSGLELNTDILSVLGKHPNIVAVKLTCGGVAKLVNIDAEFEKDNFCALSGFTDWLLPGLAAGSAGAISGFANLCPKACMKIYQLYGAGEFDAARAVQKRVAQSEWWLNKTGINGTKWAVGKLLGYEKSRILARRPYPVFKDEKMKIAMMKALQPLFQEEVIDR